MPGTFDPKANYLRTIEAVGYVYRRDATQSDYDRIGFMSGLEVHQQLDTKEKLFCHCPAGIYQKPDDFDAEIIRHMRPTLSELGEYDGTALMEFKTRKTIIYRIKSPTACTYEIDDTPPFRINQQALAKAIEISLLCRLNIVGEVHITRKQYLDGSIPTGFQRTAIIGLEGEIPLENKTIRLMQLSLEEDSCREVSDVGHLRVFRTDRLGMPLIETVTYPDMTNPDEVMEACNYIRFLNRSTGKVRTGTGSGRQDVNVSCRGGTRVEIKGVAHSKWIPKLTHNEAFRQWALLHIREILRQRLAEPSKWKMEHQQINPRHLGITYAPLAQAKSHGHKVVAVNLPLFNGILSHFTQPGKMFADEISERLQVIACIEKPHMVHTEELEPQLDIAVFDRIAELFEVGELDAQLIFWGPDDDIATALETIEERCLMAFEGVPRETRKSFEDGTTIFERVLPGADRMYPDTDSPPIPLDDDYIENLHHNLPDDVRDRYKKLQRWGVPEDTYTYILKKNLFPLIERIVGELGLDPVFIATFLGHTMKYVEGHYKSASGFNYKIIFGLFKFLKDHGINPQLAKKMLPVVYEYPKMEFESVLISINFKPKAREDILARIQFLQEKFEQIKKSLNPAMAFHWIMGQLRPVALGNMDLKELSHIVEKNLNH
ncbi:MAG: Glu-tRNA(Gln) amidotransferase subunit GatE [Bacteroidales bacterium]|nr:Glu-tRNA(Gln) amidotransferase subunit GatE [Bacteroidales bacterium]MDZ4204336.1 Glu-tRNA(Gln) amidotransferase subunit GatE [Bacteroidales bacterium]